MIAPVMLRDIAGDPANWIAPVLPGLGLRLRGSSSGYVGLKAPAAGAAIDFTLPSADGTTGQAIITNGSGVLAFGSFAATNHNHDATYATIGHNHSGVYQPLATVLTSLSALANASGVLTNDGAGNLSWAAGGGGVTDHGALTGLGDDDHSIYALLAGRAGGQTLIGGTAASENLTLSSTSHGTKGAVVISGITGSAGTDLHIKFPTGNVGLGSANADTLQLHAGGRIQLMAGYSGGDYVQVVGGSGGPRLELGAASATPSASVVMAADGSGTNIAGASMTLAGGRGTGTGAGGSVLIQVAPAGSTGASLNSLSTLATFSPTSPNVLIQALAATHIGLTLKAAASATAAIQDWQTSAGTQMAGMYQTSGVARLYFGSGNLSSAADTQHYISLDSAGLSFWHYNIRCFVADVGRCLVPVSLQFSDRTDGPILTGTSSFPSTFANGGNSRHLYMQVASGFMTNSSPGKDGKDIFVIPGAGANAASGNTDGGAGGKFEVYLRAGGAGTGTGVAGAGAKFVVSDAGTAIWTFAKDKTLTFADQANVVFNTTTGTKIGTANTQKLGFWNATPVVQPASANQAALTDSTGGTADGTVSEVTDLSTADTYTDAAVNVKFDIVNDNFKEVLTLLNQLRSDLVAVGLIKGAS